MFSIRLGKTLGHGGCAFASVCLHLFFHGCACVFLVVVVRLSFVVISCCWSGFLALRLTSCNIRCPWNCNWLCVLLSLFFASCFCDVSGLISVCYFGSLPLCCVMPPPHSTQWYQTRGCLALVRFCLHVLTSYVCYCRLDSRLLFCSSTPFHATEVLTGWLWS